MDNNYPSTLPTDYCVMEVWDICKGDVEEVYSGKADQNTMKCYRTFCPKLKWKQNSSEKWFLYKSEYPNVSESDLPISLKC